MYLDLRYRTLTVPSRDPESSEPAPVYASELTASVWWSVNTSPSVYGICAWGIYHSSAAITYTCTCTHISFRRVLVSNSSSFHIIYARRSFIACGASLLGTDLFVSLFAG